MLKLKVEPQKPKPDLFQINSPLSVAFAAGGLQVSHGPVEDVGDCGPGLQFLFPH